MVARRAGLYLQGSRMTRRSICICGSVPFAGLFLVALAACEAPAPAGEEESASPAGVASAEPPSHLVPRWIGDEGAPEFEDGAVRFRDISQVMNGIGTAGSIHRASEMGHANYRDELSGGPMAERGRAWLELSGMLQQSFIIDERVAGRLRIPEETPDVWRAESATLEDLAIGASSYLIHHRAGRWSDHGLEAILTYAPTPLMVAPGLQVLRDHHRNGLFFPTPEAESTDLGSMAFGMSALRGHIYAWVREQKPGSDDDHGRVSEDRLEISLGVGREELLGISRAVALQLDEAWDEEVGMYRFPGANGTPGGGTARRYVRVDLTELGALLRGQKAIWEMLYVFGDDEDRERARIMAERSTGILMATMELTRPWGLPIRLRFGPNGIAPERDEVDVEALWVFVNDLTGGFSWNREREGTARLLSRFAPEALEAVGRFTDEVLVGALEHHLDAEGIPMAVVCYAEGSPRDARRSPAVVGAFLTAAANAYTTGEAFAPPERWEGSDPAREETGRESADAGPEVLTRALYDALIRNVEFLEDVALRPGDAVP